jgi:hypothetical protein
MVEAKLKDRVEWRDSDVHRGVPVFQVTLKEGAVPDLLNGDVTLFCATANGALIIALRDWLLRRLIDERLDAGGPASAPAIARDGEQLSFELAGEGARPLRTALAWLLEKRMLDSASAASSIAAETIFHGAPESALDSSAVRALSFAYFGAAPMTPDGAVFAATTQGPRDPARGTAFAPVWPEVPVAHSPVAAIASLLDHLSAQISFDDEDTVGREPLRSMHARVVFDVSR